MSRYDLTDSERRVIQLPLPHKARGVPRVENRCVLNGNFWVLRSGMPLRDFPERKGREQISLWGTDLHQL